MIADDAFDLSMKFSSRYQDRIDQEKWDLLKNAYELFQNQKTKKAVIPKIIHQIWLGGEPPKHYEKLMTELRGTHPGWEYRLWRDNQIDFELENKKLFDQATNFGQKSDILLCEILKKYGGIYLDLDFYMLKPFDELRSCDFFCGVVYDREPNLSNSIIGSSPNNPLINELLHFRKGVLSGNAMEVLDSTGPYHTTRAFFKCLPTMENIVAFPNSYFYPFPNFPEDRILGEETNAYFQKNTICCHLWHCSWIKKKQSENFIKKIMRKIFGR